MTATKDPDIEWAREVYEKIWPEDSFNHPNDVIRKKVTAVLLEARADEAEIWKIAVESGCGQSKGFLIWDPFIQQRAAELRRKAQEVRKSGPGGGQRWQVSHHTAGSGR